MRKFKGRMVPLVGAALVAALPATASAQGTELGASLVNVSVPFGDDSAVILGVPSGALGLMNPGAYVSFRLGPRAAVGPQLGLIMISEDDETHYAMNLAGQFDYFLRDSGGSAPYLFGTAGLVSASNEDTVGTFGGGMGYRMRLGDRLTLRIDGRYLRWVSDNGGMNLVSFTVAIGGLFGGS